MVARIKKILGLAGFLLLAGALVGIFMTLMYIN